MPDHTDFAAILSPKTSVSGLSQSQLGNAWWNTIYAIPAEQHFGLFDDIYDPRGRRGSVEKAAKAQFDKATLFIGGGFGDLASRTINNVTKIQRTVVLPNQGKGTVFLPILNASFDNLVNDPKDPNNLTGNLTGEQLQTLISKKLDKVSNGGWVSDLFASVDGKKVNTPFRYRQASEKTFKYKAPFPTKDGLLSSGGYTDESYLDNDSERAKQLKDLATGKTVAISPAVSDGYWLAVDVKGGDHVLTFGGTLSDGGQPFFSLDVTYNILNPIYGTKGKDILTGSLHNDYITGGDRDDYLWGDKGRDLLLGGKGRDVILGGKGQDELWGDEGIDSFVFNNKDGKDTLFDFSAGETVKLIGLGSPRSISDVKNPASGVIAAQVDFGGGDILTFIGAHASELSVQNGTISLV